LPASFVSRPDHPIGRSPREILSDLIGNIAKKPPRTVLALPGVLARLRSPKGWRFIVYTFPTQIVWFARHVDVREILGRSEH
jgi:hypothetical protein